MSYIGNTKIGKMYLGNTEIAKAYLGNNLVFQKGGSPAPSDQPIFYDRLVFDGTAYIDTDIVPDLTMSYRMAIGDESQKIPQRYFFAPTADSGFVGITLNSTTTSTNRCFSVYFGKSSSVSGNRTYAFSNATLSLWLTPKRFGWGNTAYTFTKGSNAVNGPIVIGQSSTHSGQAFTGRLGWFRIYSSDAQDCASNSAFNSFTPVYTLRPCTYRGEPGMWCVETEKFYGNTAGAGALSVINNS